MLGYILHICNNTLCAGVCHLCRHSGLAGANKDVHFNNLEHVCAAHHFHRLCMYVHTYVSMYVHEYTAQQQLMMLIQWFI